MEVGKTKYFVKRYQRLPQAVQKKIDKQIQFLGTDFFYPSLRTKKLEGKQDWWEFRIDYHYRMIGKKINNSIILHSVGPHDEGLGKK